MGITQWWTYMNAYILSEVVDMFLEFLFLVFGIWDSGINVQIAYFYFYFLASGIVG
jgi:hypothetical protein